MEEKLQFMPTLQEAFTIGIKNLTPIVFAGLLWLITIWIPYVNVGTTIAMATLPVKLSKGEIISPMFIFDAEYRHQMGEYFILQAIISSAISVAMLFMFVPGVVLTYSWMLAVYLLVGKKMNWAKCLSESNRLMMGYKLKVFFIKFVVSFCIGFVTFVLFALLKNLSGFLAIMVVLAMILVSVCVINAVDAVIYRELVLAEDGETEESVDPEGCC